MVPGRARDPRLARTGTSTSGATRSREEKPGDVVFPDEENSIWAWDEEAGALVPAPLLLPSARPQRGQPTRCATRSRRSRASGSNSAVDGFRVDAAPYLVEPTGPDARTRSDPHDLLRYLRRYVSRRNGDADADRRGQPARAELRPFFGDEDGDELHMLFNFNLNQALFLALAREDASRWTAALRDACPSIPEGCQWVNFVRNHDELTLDKLATRSAQEVFARSPRARRCSSTVAASDDGCPRCWAVTGGESGWCTAWLFTLPGTPALLWGEEIGLGENLGARGRLQRCARRCSGQTSRNGGFSTADERRAARSSTTGPYGFQRGQRGPPAPRPRARSSTGWSG